MMTVTPTYKFVSKFAIKPITLSVLTLSMLPLFAGYAHSAPLYMDYVVKNPQYESHMPYDTIHGVMGEDGKVIVPAIYESVKLTYDGDRTYLLGVNPYATEQVIHRFDEAGHKIETLDNHSMGGGVMILPFTLEPNEGASDDSKKFFEEMESIFEERTAHLSDDSESEKKAIARNLFFEMVTKNSHLVNHATGERVDLSDKDIAQLQLMLLDNELKHQIIPARSTKNNLWGYVNPQAQWVIEPMYDSINGVSSDWQIIDDFDEILGVYRNEDPEKEDFGCMGLIDIHGKKRGDVFRNMYYSHEGYAIATSCQRGVNEWESDYKGIINQHGQWLVKLHGDLKVRTLPDKDGYFVVENSKTDKEGIMHILGKWIIPAEYYFPNISISHNHQSAVDLPLFDTQELIAVKKDEQDSHYGFMNKDGVWVMDDVLPVGETVFYDMNSYRFDEHGFAYGRLAGACDCRVVFDVQGRQVFTHQGNYGDFNEQGYAPFVADGTNVMQIIDKHGLLNKRELLAMTKPRLMLNDKQYKRLKPILLEIGLYDKPNLRKTVEGVLYRMKVGLPWRDLPKYFGKHNTVYKAFNRWSANNKLILLFNKVIDQPGMEWVFIDGSHIKAHHWIAYYLIFVECLHAFFSSTYARKSCES
ncbi:hypothetical protein B5J94_02875 [Moraxella lacunata]|uniref:Insertion element IS402-like domain-containing protein n=2 Tax=Moraxella lacunata TaxID=477 RepID=A0A1V4H124_MORLA|nr:hypothetical protein B5J94_02875 [Moraxella lacunata]